MPFMTDHIESKNLVPFSKRRNTFQLPGVRKDRDEEMLEQVDPDLTAEDEGVIRRYLQYADTLLGSPDLEGLSLVQGGGPAKQLAGVPDKLRQPAPETPSIQDGDQNARSEEPESESSPGGTDQAA
jgi:hypothetical protein